MNKVKAALMNPERINNFFTCPGNKLKMTYYGKVLEDGNIELIEDSLVNTDDEIDSYREESEIENIIARVNAGDVGLLNARSGEYIDCVGMPKSYAEVLQKVIDGKTIFDKLPVEIKQRFDNDFNQWFAQMGNEDWYEKSGFIQRIQEETKENKVENES